MLMDLAFYTKDPDWVRDAINIAVGRHVHLTADVHDEFDA